ncbi:ABC transporter ATP-binding protein [Nocardioidaceae bacterium SCSIO 66511]|nr:ABC transporter ATP-binding protein [Nocardioidaceae bacterium SCSIO 66511]
MDLQFDGLGVIADGKRIVDALSLDVERGETVGIIGPNGSGKSTVLRCAYRALRPTTGVVRLGGTDVATQSLRQSALRLAALAQQHDTHLDFTAWEVVALGRAPHHRGNEALSDSEHDVCADAMRKLGVLDLADRLVTTLSGGERQRVLIARALAQEPSVLVLDEPTNHLDLRHQIDVLEHLATTELTILVVLHDLNLAAATCDRLAVMSEGRLVAYGQVEDILTPHLVRDVFGVDATLVCHPLTGQPQLLYAVGGAGPARKEHRNAEPPPETNHDRATRDHLSPVRRLRSRSERR